MATRGRRTRVVHILEATIGGTKKHLLQIAELLDRDRFELSLVCSALRDASFRHEIEELRRRGIEVRVVQMRREIAPVSDLVAFAQIYSLLRANPPDIVHTHSSKAGFLGRAAAWLAGVPHIFYTPHAFPFMQDVSRRSRRFYVALERLAARATEKIVVLSQFEKQAALSGGICPPGKAVLIPNGIDVSELDPPGGRPAALSELGVPEGTPVIGSLGRLTQQKGYRYLIEAAPRTLQRFPNARFIIAGEGELRGELLDHISALGVARQVFLIGHTDRVAALYSLLDVFVLPSLWEALPYTVLEAMAARKPIVVSQVCGMERLVKEGETGVLVPPRSPDALADSVCRLLDDDQLRNRLGENARRSVQRNFPVATMMERLQGLYLSGQGAS